MKERKTAKQAKIDKLLFMEEMNLDEDGNDLSPVISSKWEKRRGVKEAVYRPTEVKVSKFQSRKKTFDTNYSQTETNVDPYYTEKMIFCPMCGKEIPEDASFCVKCGIKIEISDH